MNTPLLSARTNLLLRTLAPHTGLSADEIGANGKEGYARFMRATHAYIRTSVPLMVEARARFAQLVGQDHIVSYLDHHIEEEMRHDVWTIEDLAEHGLNTDTSDVELIPEIAAACGTQYYHVHHGNPWLFFGYIFSLESFPPGAELIEHLIASTGLPPSAFRTLQVHSDLDQEHASDLADLIDTFELGAEAESAFQFNALASSTQISVGVRRALSLPS